LLLGSNQSNIFMYPLRNFNVLIEFDKDLLLRGYRFCDYTTELNSTLSLEKKFECLSKCETKCETISFETRMDSTKSKTNQTILEIIPIVSPMIRYKEFFSTDLNQLIYNCGGTLGLWFGISPIKFADSISLLTKLIILLKLKLLFMIYIIKMICFYLIQNSLIIVDYCKRILRSYFWKLSAKFILNIIFLLYALVYSIVYLSYHSIRYLFMFFIHIKLNLVSLYRRVLNLWITEWFEISIQFRFNFSDILTHSMNFVKIIKFGIIFKFEKLAFYFITLLLIFRTTWMKLNMKFNL